MNQIIKSKFIESETLSKIESKLGSSAKIIMTMMALASMKFYFTRWFCDMLMVISAIVNMVE